ncbi:MAG TPA: protein kinase [Vicinamibacteria bacterium]|nr:protein kinase [Vicinamibacteria bacterium]
MSLSAGSRLGPYEVLAPLGAGGMGEVYRARDTRLDRTVAIKVLPAEVSASPERRARFEREARTISQLNHAHICTLHDVGHDNGVDFLVMECLEGETLLERLRRGPLSLDNALRYAVEIADALEAAQKNGIVHRDLKPGNVMLTKAGAKLLDFGLAKHADGRAPTSLSQASALPTSDKPLTSEGSLLGTFQYMAPEQLEGREADARSDIWALGTVIYEMTTGQRAFQGKSQASLVAAILQKEPPPASSIRPLTPPALDRLVKMCLAKDPDDRWQSAHDVRAELEWIAQGGGAVAPVVTGRARALLWVGIALAAGVGVGNAAIRFLVSPPVPRPTMLLSILPPESGRIGNWLALSPDGRQIVFDVTREGRRQLWLRALAEADARPLAGTEDALVPFWSPDSRSLGFFARGKLRRLDLDGSPPRTLADAPVPRGGAWGGDGHILFTPVSNSPLLRVPAFGGTVSEATTLGDGHFGHRWPSFLPDGRRFLLMVWSTTPSKRGIYVGSAGSREVRLIQNSPRRAAFAGGRLIFAAGEALLARPFDLDRLEPKGEPSGLASRVSWDTQLWGHSSFSVAEAGVVAFRSGVPSHRLTWYDRSGRVDAAIGPDGIVQESPQASPDRRMLAFASIDRETDRWDVWLLDLARNTTSRVTSGADSLNPLWSADGSSLLYRSDREEGFLLVRKSLRGGGQEEVLVKDSNWFNPEDCSRDDRFLLYTRPHPQNRLDLWVLPLSGDRQGRPLLATPYDEYGAQFSPDGAWIAYVSDESGRNEVYIRRFPATEEKWQVSTQGGQQPRWRDDGNEIFFIDAAGLLMASTIATRGEPSIGTPVRLFSIHIEDVKFSAGRRPLYVASHDGQRFLVVQRAEEGGGSISVLVGAEALATR